VDSLNEQYPIEGRPAEAAVLIRSAVIKLERAKRQLFNLKNRFSYTTKHKKDSQLRELAFKCNS
jgi:hypothetical protein